MLQIVLLSRGAKVDSVTSEGLTPVHIASQKGNLEILKLLVDNHAKIGVKTPDGSTALHLAAAGDKHDIIIFLLKAERGLAGGISSFIEIRNLRGLRAQDVAQLNGSYMSRNVLKKPHYHGIC